MAQDKFGKFKSFDEFLVSYKAAEESARAEAEKELPFEERVRRRRQQTQTRHVVAVGSKLRVREPDGGGEAVHIRLRITITDLEQGDPAVNADVQRVLASGEDVFLAIRTGDSMGITGPIEGLVEGVVLKVQGEWIPKDRAQAHGGEPMSVLHFTHHPLGFICVATPPKCYS